VPIPAASIRRDIAFCIDRSGSRFTDQPHKLFRRLAMPHDQLAAALGKVTGKVS